MSSHRTIYADPELAAEYTAGAWSAALQANRRIALLTLLIVGLVLPLAFAGYYLGQRGREEAILREVTQSRVLLQSFQEVDSRLKEAEARLAAAATERAEISRQAGVTTTTPAPPPVPRSTPQSKSVQAPVAVPATVPVTAPPTTAAPAPPPPPVIGACVLTICLEVKS